jgi:hypothetical protein
MYLTQGRTFIAASRQRPRALNQFAAPPRPGFVAAPSLTSTRAAGLTVIWRAVASGSREYHELNSRRDPRCYGRDGQSEHGFRVGQSRAARHAESSSNPSKNGVRGDRKRPRPLGGGDGGRSEPLPAGGKRCHLGTTFMPKSRHACALQKILPPCVRLATPPQHSDQGHFRLPGDLI